MNMHKNARLTPLGRERIVRQVESGQTPEAISETAGVCPRTVRKWVGRYRREGLAGLQDRSSRPHRLRRPTPQTVIEEIERLRRQRWTGKQIAAQVGVSPATVSRVLRRLGLNKLNALEPAEPVRRYERENPGELIHNDIRSSAALARWACITGRQTGVVNATGIGWEYVHVCIDDASPVATYRHGQSAQRGASHSSRPPLLLPQPQPSHRAGDDRQRLMLSIKDVPGSL
jgi:transposase